MSILKKMSWVCICVCFVCCTTSQKQDNQKTEQQDSQKTEQQDSQKTEQQNSQKTEQQDKVASSTQDVKNTLLQDKAGLQNVQISAPKSTIPFNTIKIALNPVIPQPIENKRFNIAQVKKQLPVKKEQKIEDSSPTIKSYSDIAKLPKKIDGEILLKKGTYYLEKSVTITRKGTLIIEPGTEIEMDACAVICNGKLISKGSKNSPIVFSGDAWDNISVFGEGSSAILEHCEIRGGSGMGVQQENGQYTVTPQFLDITYGGGVLVAQKAKVVMQDCKIENVYGVNMLAVINSTLTLKNCKLVEHDQQGIFSLDGKLTLTNSRLENQSGVALQFSGVNIAKIENNIFVNCNTAIAKTAGTVASLKNNKFENCEQKVTNK
ncbi:right-handed parallel beta-helix repeat-containing protein [Candidatus Uabimicrobium sp. HlEnr_7]|uniref:right-handed parallel beta-helix repeat-containing protein n=1 Tax=Candidatus Uabimicrobium helgolandensis TaxID=3095367 RepID=UPI003557DF81